MSRRKGRILAFQAMYQWDVGGVTKDDLLKLSWSDSDTAEPVDDESAAFARILISGTIDHIAEIDEAIANHLAPSWKMDRVNKVTLAILRMSVYSLLYQKDLHPTIVIDEAIDIAKEFGPEDAFKFINAVLDNISKAQEKQG